MGLISNSTNNGALRWECHGDKAYLHLFTFTGLRKMVVKLYLAHTSYGGFLSHGGTPKSSSSILPISDPSK